MRKTKLTDKMNIVLNGGNPDFNEHQLKIIKKGLKNGLSTEQVSLYAKPEFNEFQMDEILNGFENHIPDNLVALYANPVYDTLQMSVMRTGFINGVTKEQASIYSDPEYTAQQMHIIMHGFVLHLPIEEINIYADKKFDADQMCEIMYALQIKVAPVTEIIRFADSKYCAPKLALIYKSLQSGLTPEQICLFTNLEFNTSQMNEIFLGLSSTGLTEGQVKMYANPKYSSDQMLTFRELLRRGVCENEIIHSINEVECIFEKGDYTNEQRKEIYNGLSLKLAIDQIKFGAQPEFSPELMSFIFSGFSKGLSESQIQFCLDNGRTTEIQDEIFRDLTNGLTEKQIKYYLSHKCTRHQKDVYRTLIAENAPYPDRYIDNITHFKRKTSTECADILSIYSAKNVDLKKLDVLAQKPLSPEQMQFILNSLIKNDVTKNIHQRNENDRKDISQMEK